MFRALLGKEWRQIRTLRRFERVWASGGTPNAVFAVGLDDAVAAAEATWADIAQA